MRDDEFMVGSWSDHARIVPALELTLQLFSAVFSLILECNFEWQAQYLVRLVMPVAPRIVNDVSCATRTNDACHFSWQEQYLVTLVDDTCCSAHCK